jgi:hypothetical protein
MIGIAALVVGIVLGLVFHPSVPEVIQPYLPIAVVAALDAVFGGLRAYLERIFVRVQCLGGRPDRLCRRPVGRRHTIVDGDHRRARHPHLR